MSESRLRRLLALVVLVTAITAGTTHAQSNLWLQDSVSFDRNQLPFPISDKLIAAAYHIRMDYDSARVTYKFTEAFKNSTRLRLSNWDPRRGIHDIDEDSLAKLTTTDAFPLLTGDTVSFFREVTWQNRFSKVMDTNNYYSKDTLIYTVELIDVTNNARLAVMDSLYIGQRMTSGKPSILGVEPVARTFSYIVPSQHNNKNAFLRVKVTSKGYGLYHPVRRDAIGVALSFKLSDTTWSSFRSYYQAGYVKRSTRDLDQLISGSTAALTVSPNPVTLRATITYAPPVGGGTVSVVVYDVTGKPLAIVDNGSEILAEKSVTHNFETPGNYYVVLNHNGIPVSSQKIVVTR